MVHIGDTLAARLAVVHIRWLHRVASVACLLNDSVDGIVPVDVDCEHLSLSDGLLHELAEDVLFLILFLTHGLFEATKVDVLAGEDPLVPGAVGEFVGPCRVTNGVANRVGWA